MKSIEGIAPPALQELPLWKEQKIFLNAPLAQLVLIPLVVVQINAQCAQQALMNLIELLVRNVLQELSPLAMLQAVVRPVNQEKWLTLKDHHFVKNAMPDLLLIIRLLARNVPLEHLVKMESVANVLVEAFPYLWELRTAQYVPLAHLKWI
jgi:hypothetical protein